MTKPVRHFLDLDQIDKAELRGILERAKRIKHARAGYPKGRVDEGAPLSGYLLAAVFERESTRTRVSFDVGMRQLGGQTIVLSGNDTQLGRGETVADTARVLSRFVDVIMLRTAKHQHLLDMAAHASVPVINGLSDLTHPCQLMADVMTIEEHIGSIAGRRVAWTGDGNNVAASLVHAAVRFDFELAIATPPEFAMPESILAWASEHQGRVTTTTDPKEAVRDADVVITDTFVSMGQTGAEARLQTLAPYQVEEQLMSTAKRDAVFLHCLPAHRGEEVSEGVIDGPQSLVWDEAENRLHAQKAILLWCLQK